jgi:hypothetical protein
VRVCVCVCVCVTLLCVCVFVCVFFPSLCERVEGHLCLWGEGLKHCLATQEKEIRKGMLCNVLFVLLSVLAVIVCSSAASVGNIYNVGVGIYDMTGPAAEINFMGYASTYSHSLSHSHNACLCVRFCVFNLSLCVCVCFVGKCVLFGC